MLGMAQNAPAIPPPIIGNAPKKTNFISANPCLIKGPVEISPLNIATINPVDLITNVSIEVNASIKGVNITPPPTPAITKITAIIELKIKDITSYMLWNVVNAFMKCFDPLFELIIPTYKNLDNVKIRLNKTTKINIGLFLKEIVKYIIMLTLIYYIRVDLLSNSRYYILRAMLTMK